MSHFLAYLARMKHVQRWGLMKNTYYENDMEHSYMVIIISHMLTNIMNIRYNGMLDEKMVVLYATYHEATEVLTGDLPTPIKYFDSEIRSSYARIEEIATRKLSKLIPEDLRKAYDNLLMVDKECPEYKIVKAADRIAAYIKCVEELKTGNQEFNIALKDIKSDIDKLDCQAVVDFMQEFAPSFNLTLEELGMSL